MSLYRLCQQVGAARARQVLLWSSTITAATAIEIGLIDQIDDAVDRATHRILSLRRPGAEMAVRRRLVLEATSTPYEDALGTQLAACDRELRRIRRHTL
jgi:isomerase DpgB